MEKQRHYGKVTGALTAELTGIVGDRNVLTGEDRENYARDEAPGSDRAVPDLVVKPGDAGEVAGVLRLANEARVPVIVRGAGTGLCGGAVAF